MSLPTFFAGAPEPGERVILEGDDARHAGRALRLAPGDRLTSSDGRGTVAVCRVVAVEAGRVEAAVEDRTAVGRPVPALTVALAAPKGERLWWAVQKLTELGTDAIVVLEAERSVRRWSGERAQRLGDRLRAVSVEAAKQSRRPFLPEVAGPRPWAGAVEDAVSGGVAVVLWEGAKAGLTSVLPERPPDRVSLLVGPEGGIPEHTAVEAERRGALLASLGPSVLRTETAAVAAAAVALAEYGRLGG